MPVITLVASLVTLLLSASQLRIEFDYFTRRELTIQRIGARIVTGMALIVIVTGPVAAMSFGPLQGWDLALTMVFGAVQVVVLAMQLAILHHTRVAIEAKA